MRRFLTQIEPCGEDELRLSPELLRHIRTVLRMKVGEEVLLTEGQRMVYRCRLSHLEEGGGRARILERLEEPDERVRVQLLQGLPKFDKLEWIIQKGTELGAESFVPVATRRTVVKLDDKRGAAKHRRWEKIALEAARQSTSSIIPEVKEPDDLEAALKACSAELRFVLWEEECPRLRSLLPAQAPASIALLVGPEGGLSEEEVALARSHDFTPVSLGARILRTETAGIATLAILQYLYGDLG